MTTTTPPNDGENTDLPKPMSKKQLKKLAKHGNKPKKEKPKWNLPGAKNAGAKPKSLNLNENEVFVNKTPAGEKKDLSGSIAEKYNPNAVESAWDTWWEKKGFYTCTPEEVRDLPDDKKFIMVLPPPNVTGTLHIGHALMLTVQDALARFHRMQGKKVLWVPGTDHAGIGTQAAVEAQMMKKENLRRLDVPREEFMDRVWAFKEEKGGIIMKQVRRMGASMDFTREVFTMDETRTKAVTHAFIKLHEMGLIYRKERLVNWCSQLGTALSNIEVDSLELEKRTMLNVKSHGKKKYEFGVLTEFKYKIVDSEEMLTVATTRLETMLGDTAVCVHPDDPRYKHLQGGFVQHPFFNRKIPIITDADLVDMEFGTGCVKITPAHDENDFKCGERHQLPFINMMSDDGKITVVDCKSNASEECLGDKFDGMMRYDARVAIEKELESLGLLGEKKDNKMVLPVCSKSGDIIEPRLKKQWWVDTNEMAKRSIDAVANGDLKIQPTFHIDTWNRFLTDPHQWCISRQLWWGHRIPAYKITVDGNEEWIVAKDEEAARSKIPERFPNLDASKVELTQDEDVLDTWFSSGLFPFSVFGWPDQTEDLKSFFPGTLLETGHDILFFWVARMVMMSLTLEGKLPFSTVYLHAIVRDRYGRKMSKSLGNIIDPLAVINGCTLRKLNDTIRNSNLPDKEIEKAVKGQIADFPEGIPQCGSDALRFGLLANINHGRDMNLDVNNIFTTRKFCNKLWQVTRFSILMCGENLVPESDFINRLSEFKLASRDKWILTQLRDLVKDCNSAVETFSFGDYTSSLTAFWVGKLCDVYVESIKPVLKNDAQTSEAIIARNVLFVCLDLGLKLLHPAMPFLTEELWQQLPGNKQRLLAFDATKNETNDLEESIMVSSYPTEQSMFTENFENEVVLFEKADDVAHAMRSLKSDYNIKKRDVEFIVICDEQRSAALKELVGDIEVLGGGKASVELESELEKFSKGFVAVVLDGHLQVLMEIKGNVDINARLKKLEKEMVNTTKKIEQMNKKLGNEKFVSNVTQEVIDETKAKVTDLEGVVEKLGDQMKALSLL